MEPTSSSHRGTSDSDRTHLGFASDSHRIMSRERFFSDSGSRFMIWTSNARRRICDSGYGTQDLDLGPVAQDLERLGSRCAGSGTVPLLNMKGRSCATGPRGGEGAAGGGNVRSDNPSLEFRSPHTRTLLRLARSHARHARTKRNDFPLENIAR